MSCVRLNSSVSPFTSSPLSLATSISLSSCAARRLRYRSCMLSSVSSALGTSDSICSISPSRTSRLRLSAFSCPVRFSRSLLSSASRPPSASRAISPSNSASVMPLNSGLPFAYMPPDAAFAPPLTFSLSCDIFISEEREALPFWTFPTAFKMSGPRNFLIFFCPIFAADASSKKHDCTHRRLY